jgi:hypothetical protein
MQNSRVLFAFLLAPLVPVVIYFLYVLAMVSLPHQGATPPVNLFVFVFALLPFTYGFTLVIWLPSYIVMKRKGLTGLRHYVLAGAALFFLVTLLFAIHNPMFLFFSVICSGLGALYGLVFWRLATPSNFSRAL